MHSKRRNIFLLAFFLAACVCFEMVKTPSVFGQNGESAGKIQFKTGPSLSKALAETLSISQKNQPVRTVLRDLSKNKQVAIFLDRRTDPSREIDLAVKNKTLVSVLYQIADQCNAGYVRIEDVIYIGPTPAAAELFFEYKNARRRISKLKNSQLQKLWRERQTIQWTRLSTPAKILENTIDGKVEITTQSLPHDLWPAGNFPKTSLLGRVCLLATGFGLTPVVDEAKPEFSLIQSKPAGNHKASYLVGDRDAVQEAITKKFSEAKVSRRGKGLDVTGNALVHAFLRRASVMGQSSKTHYEDGEEKRVSVDTEATIEGLLGAVARQLDVELKISGKAKNLVGKRIKVVEKEVTYKALIQKILADTGLEFELTDEKLIIR